MKEATFNWVSYFKALPKLAKALIVLMILTVLTFFAQSMLPRDVSSAESQAVAGFLSSILSYDSAFGSFVIDNIRKIGHFCEYGLFGAEAAVYVSFYVDKKQHKRFLFMFFVLATFVALCDETIQIFSGRGPSVSDVWLDVCGFVSLGLLSYLVIYVTKCFMKPSKDN